MVDNVRLDHLRLDQAANASEVELEEANEVFMTNAHVLVIAGGGEHQEGRREQVEE